VLARHEIVNDRIGDVPIAVTYCSLCDAARVFDRRVDDRTLTFEVSGRLYPNDLVMVDTQTDSLWPQILGKALHGPLAGQQLAPIRAPVTTGQAWRRLHSRSRVLSRPKRFRQGAYAPRTGDHSSRLQTVFDRVNLDPRLNPQTLVFGVQRGNDALAIRLEDLERVETTVATVDQEPMLFAYVLDHPVAWWLDDHEITIKGETSRTTEGQLVDPWTGTIDDPPLDWAQGLACDWGAWAAFAPGTRLWHENE
jgi:hypothetical protein